MSIPGMESWRNNVYNMKEQLIRYRKPLIITASVIALQLIFGFDPKFCIMNIIWLFV